MGAMDDGGSAWGTAVDSPTEERNERTRALDQVPTRELLELINAEDHLVPGAVATSLPHLVRLVDLAAERVARGGTVHYVGAGTSGRLAVIDAAELLPTFQLHDGVVVAHLAGGDAAISRAAEGAEDDYAAGRAALAGVGAEDVVIGLAASGRTPFVAGAIAQAAEQAAVTALVTSNPRAGLLGQVDVPIVVDTGPEALTGSTRLKAGTAQKLILHTFSTALMVRLGRTWSNLMVSVVATNEKLRARTVTILCQATGLSRTDSAAVLSSAGGDLKVGLVMALTDAEPAQARAALERSGGVVRDAVRAATP